MKKLSLAICLAVILTSSSAFAKIRLVESCTGLTSCPQHATCTSCRTSNTKTSRRLYKVKGCQSGYELRGDRCIKELHKGGINKPGLTRLQKK